VSHALYVETSALLRALLEGDRALASHIHAATARVTSALTFLEAHRAVVRATQDARLSPDEARAVLHEVAAFERSTDVLDMDDEVLRLARGPFAAEPVRTLDAIHLASIRILDEQTPGGLDVASCDDRVRRNVVALGFTIIPK
jgi:predicted nucleic acid-binding protein